MIPLNLSFHNAQSYGAVEKDFDQTDDISASDIEKW